MELTENEELHMIVIDTYIANLREQLTKFTPHSEEVSAHGFHLLHALNELMSDPSMRNDVLLLIHEKVSSAYWELQPYLDATPTRTYHGFPSPKDGLRHFVEQGRIFTERDNVQRENKLESTQIELQELRNQPKVNGAKGPKKKMELAEYETNRRRLLMRKEVDENPELAEQLRRCKSEIEEARVMHKHLTKAGKMRDVPADKRNDQREDPTFCFMAKPKVMRDDIIHLLKHKIGKYSEWPIKILDKID